MKFKATNRKNTLLNVYHLVATILAVFTFLLSIICICASCIFLPQHKHHLAADWKNRLLLADWWNEIQEKYQCCGLTDGLDWVAVATNDRIEINMNETIQLPYSCCNMLVNKQCLPTNMHTVSCETRVYNIYMTAMVLGVISCILAILQIYFSFYYSLNYLQYSCKNQMIVSDCIGANRNQS